MAITTAVTGDHLTRSNLWSAMLKEILLDELDAQRWVDWMDDFPDGTTFNIPSAGQATVQDITEDQAVTYESLDTGNFTFTITEYVGSAHYITKAALQDSFYGQRLLASFVPKESRAIMEYLETDILKQPGPNGNGGQTASNAETINGYDHRFVASGGSDTARTVNPEDFAYAKLALKKANVPMSNLVAIVDPEVAYFLETLTNLVNVSNNPRWEGIIESGLTTGMRFIRNVYGFDVYESNYLDVVGAETITGGPGSGSRTTGASAVQNVMFSAEQSVLPIIGAWRQTPEVDSEYNKDLQREEYVTTARWGTKLYRPENMVCVLSDPTA